ncbi:hypothetical protein BU16DRAFT_308620 [Lophium mytilinum]|uniref:PWI domain-containing protein n=1 Tax=Lophium mytilinum TaxID=390894 RepID=A0A6A6R4L6_9PEZI|nr:hypothetical protein BU16DRAFT_308620 [Lophium mytilinum]
MATTTDQKLLKATKFPPEFDIKVYTKKVNIEVLKKWITNRITTIMGTEDDIVIETCFNLLDVERPDIKSIQIALTGFLDKDAASFCKELWLLCISAQNSDSGVPKELLEAKKKELIQEKNDSRPRPESDVNRTIPETETLTMCVSESATSAEKVAAVDLAVAFEATEVVDTTTGARHVAIPEPHRGAVQLSKIEIATNQLTAVATSVAGPDRPRVGTRLRVCRHLPRSSPATNLHPDAVARPRTTDVKQTLTHREEDVATIVAGSDHARPDAACTHPAVRGPHLRSAPGISPGPGRLRVEVTEEEHGIGMRATEASLHLVGGAHPRPGHGQLGGLARCPWPLHAVAPLLDAGVGRAVGEAQAGVNDPSALGGRGERDIAPHHLPLMTKKDDELI